MCGDCINPLCWPVLRRLRLDETIRALPHARLERVEFVNADTQTITIQLRQGAEIAIKRSLFDSALLQRARELGAEVREATTVTALHRANDSWTIQLASGEQLRARILVAADGRNSTIARLLGCLPRTTKERVGLQAHIPLPQNFGNKVVLQLLPGGYSGQAPVNETELNLCLVGKASALPHLRSWATERFNLPRDQTWRTVTPLARRAVSSAHRNLFFVGDAARVVEPFTGEGIAYALNSGEIAASLAARLTEGEPSWRTRHAYGRAFKAIYRERLWINRLTRAAVTSPRIGALAFKIAKHNHALVRLLTSKIVGTP